MTAEAQPEKEELRRKLGQFSKYGRKFDRALDAVFSGGVKESRFIPSGRRVFTVVGNAGDEFIDPDKPYCSCSHFFFRVLTGKDETCYHLLSHRMASAAGRVDVNKFSDDEYGQVLRALVADVFNVIRTS